MNSLAFVSHPMDKLDQLPASSPTGLPDWVGRSRPSIAPRVATAFPADDDGRRSSALRTTLLQVSDYVALTAQ